MKKQFFAFLQYLRELKKITYEISLDAERGTFFQQHCGIKILQMKKHASMQ